MKLDTKITLIFRNKIGDKKELETTFKELLSKDLEDYYEDLEDGCCGSASCNNESQNFCDCPTRYEDYDIDEVVL